MMVLGGITGAIVGRKLNNLITSHSVEKLFAGLMIVIIGINIYNIYIFIK